MDIEVIFYSFVALVAIAVVSGFLYVYPKYDIYASRLSGQAELQKAESNRKIVIEEANAKKESAKALAEAEVIQAQSPQRVPSDLITPRAGQTLFILKNSTFTNNRATF